MQIQRSIPNIDQQYINSIFIDNEFDSIADDFFIFYLELKDIKNELKKWKEYDEVFNNRTFRIPKNCKFACKRVNNNLYYEFIIFNPVN